MLTQIKTAPEGIKLRHVATFFDYPPSHFTERTKMQWFPGTNDLGDFEVAHVNLDGLPYTLHSYRDGAHPGAVTLWGIAWTDDFMYATAACPAWALGWDEDEPLAEAPVVDFDESLRPRDRMGRWMRGLGMKHYKVGGAVRDPLLGKTPNDIDYMVMGSPAAIKAAVEKNGGRADELKVRDRTVGLRIHVEGVTPPEGVELAPPRVEVSTGPGRQDFDVVPHPAVMGEQPADNADVVLDDAARRDFTVNAMYEDEDGNVVDPLGGLADIEANQLRTTSPDSFRDDPLRIMRALRFMSQHGFDLAPETDAQMREHAGSITALTQGGVSGSAVKELNKLLMGQDVGKALRTARDTGALAAFLPELAPAIGFDQESKYHSLTVDEHIISVVEEAAALGGSLEVRLAALFHDAGKPVAAFRGKDGRLHYYGDATHPEHAEAGAAIARGALERLNYPKAIVDRVERLVRHHMVPVAGTKKDAKVRKWRAEVGPDLIDDLLIHRRADLRSKGEGEDVDANPEEQLDRLAEKLEAQADAPVAVSDLAVGGGDLIAAGMKPGPQVGETLRELLKHVISDPTLNRRDWLMKKAGLREPEDEGGSVIPRDQMAYIAEGAMERGGLVGRTHSIPVGRAEDGSSLGAYGPKVLELSEWASTIAGFPVRVAASTYEPDFGGDTGKATAHGPSARITVRPETTDLTILHELAHLMTYQANFEADPDNRDSGGHGEAWARTVHGLYREHLGQEAADVFGNLMWPDGEEGADGDVYVDEKGIIREGVPTYPAGHPLAGQPRPNLVTGRGRRAPGWMKRDLDELRDVIRIETTGEFQDSDGNVTRRKFPNVGVASYVEVGSRVAQLAERYSARRVYQERLDVVANRLTEMREERTKAYNDAADEYDARYEVEFGKAYVEDDVAEPKLGRRPRIADFMGDEMREEMKALSSEQGGLKRQIEVADRDALIAVLSELRPMGGEVTVSNAVGIDPRADEDVVRRTSGPEGTLFDAHKRVRENMAEVAQLLPTAWIDDINAKGSVTLQPTNVRANHKLMDGARENSVINVDPREKGTLLHELAHRLEQVYGEPLKMTGLRPLLSAAITFRNQRAGGGNYEDRERLADLLPDHGYDDDEFTWADEFFSAYVGKDYGQRATEVLTMGLQALFYPAEGRRMTGNPDYSKMSRPPLSRARKKDDIDTRDFIVGLLAVA